MIDEDIEKFDEVRSKVRKFSWPDIYKKVDYRSVKGIVDNLFSGPVYGAIGGSVRWPIWDSIEYYED